MTVKRSVLGSVRLDSDVWEAVRGMECSLNQYLRSNLFGELRVGGVQGTISVDAERKSATVNMVSAPSKTFRVMCQHCGLKFGAETPKEVLCDDCAGLGHKGSRYDCETCRLG